jgi:hypothetical protein
MELFVHVETPGVYLSQVMDQFSIFSLSIPYQHLRITCPASSSEIWNGKESHLICI